MLNSTTGSFDDYLRGVKKGAIIYSVKPRQRDLLRERDLQEWIVFVWLPHNGSIVPADVKTTSRARFEHTMVNEADEADPNHIGITSEVKFTQFPGSPTLKARVDTGATVSSLHAEQWKVNNGQVSFICPEISKNVMTVPLSDQQAVRSADGGTEYRPVIETNVNVNGKLLQGVKFNLNDRGQMKYPVLIGRNILEVGKFLINPQMEGEVGEEGEDVLPVLTEEDWTTINEAIADVELPQELNIHTPEEVSQLLNTLAESNVTFKQIVRHLRGEITESVKTLSY